MTTKPKPQPKPKTAPRYGVVLTIYSPGAALEVIGPFSTHESAKRAGTAWRDVLPDEHIDAYFSIFELE